MESYPIDSNNEFSIIIDKKRTDFTEEIDKLKSALDKLSWGIVDCENKAFAYNKSIGERNIQVICKDHHKRVNKRSDYTLIKAYFNNLKADVNEISENVLKSQILMDTIRQDKSYDEEDTKN